MFKLEKTLAPAPVTRRAQPTVLSADLKGERIAYASGKSIFLRSIDDPSDVIQYTGHIANTTVARFAPINIKDVYKVVSGDERGIVKVWEWIKAKDAKEEDAFKAAGKGDGDVEGEWKNGTGRINDVAFAPDGKRVIAVGTNARAFNLDGGSVGEIIGHAKPITSLAIKPSDPGVRVLSVVTGSEDRSVAFFGSVPLKFQSKLDGLHEKDILGVAISPDGSKLITVGADTRIQLYVYNTEGKRFEHKTTISKSGDKIGHTGTILGVSWAGDSKRFATAGAADRTVKMWDVETGTVLRSWTFGKDFNHQQVGIVWPPNRSDDLIISLSLNGDLNYIKPDSEQPVRVVQGQYHSISAMTVSGQTLFTGGGVDGKVYSWDVASGTGTIVSGDSHTTKVLGFTRTDEKLYSVALNNRLRTIDLSTKAFTDVLELPSEPRGVAAADGRVYVVLNDRIVIYVSGREAGKITVPEKEEATAVVAYGSLIAVGTSHSAVRLYKVDGSNKATQIDESTKPTSAITALAFSKDGSRLAAGTHRGPIYVYEAKADALQFVTDQWSAHTARVSCLAWNDKGTHVVSGSLDTHIFVWSYDDPTSRDQKANAHKEGVNGVAWVGEKKLASAGSDASVKIWEWKG